MIDKELMFHSIMFPYKVPENSLPFDNQTIARGAILS